MHVRLFTHGAARGNPGPSAGGYRILGNDGQLLEADAKWLGHSTNMEAGYLALVMGLLACRELGAMKVSETSDCEPMVRQLNGEYRVLEARLLPLFNRVRELAAAVGEVEYIHARRQHDEISAVDQALNALLDAEAAPGARRTRA